MFYTHFSFWTFFKILFIICFIMIHIYFIIWEEESIPEYQQSGFWDNKIVKGFLNILGTSAGIGGLYSLATNNSQEVDKHLKDIQQNLSHLRDQNTRKSFEGLYNKVDSMINHIREQQTQIDIQRNRIEQLKLILKDMNPTSPESIKMSNEIERQSLEILELERNIRSSLEQELIIVRTSIDSFSQDPHILLESIQKSSIIDSYFEWLNTFDQLGKMAISLLFLNYAILGSLISIIFIFYGDYLIKRFQLEERWPKLAKFIQIRRTFQYYYLNFSILIIFMIILSEIFFSVYVLTV